MNIIDVSTNDEHILGDFFLCKQKPISYKIRPLLLGLSRQVSAKCKRFHKSCLYRSKGGPKN